MFTCNETFVFKTLSNVVPGFAETIQSRYINYFEEHVIHVPISRRRDG